jgi:hypothetical protein
MLFHALLLAISLQGSLGGPSFQASGNVLPQPLPAEVNLKRRDSVPAGFVAAPYYPTPKGGWDSSWTSSYAKARAVVSNMTLAEKVNLTSGVGYLMVSDQAYLYEIPINSLKRALVLAILVLHFALEFHVSVYKILPLELLGLTITLLSLQG